MPQRITGERTDGEGTVLARVVRAEELSGETEFITPPSEQLQIGLLSYDAGQRAAPHTHPGVDRVLGETPELVHVEAGTIDVDIYDRADEFVTTVALEAGDTASFPAGGRGWEARTDATVIEIKQGPYHESDKREL